MTLSSDERTVNMNKDTNEKSRSGKKQLSISRKALITTLMSCIIFGLVSQIIALAFYGVSLTNQYIDFATSVALQAQQSAVKGTDAAGLSNDVMEIYRSLSDEERQKTGTAGYRALYSDLTKEKGGSYDVLWHMLKGVLSFNNIYDVYIAMYDRDTEAIVYIVDPLVDGDSDMMPGDWEHADSREINTFMNGYVDDLPRYFSWTKQYGLLCTVAIPIRNEARDFCSFLFVDVSAKEIIYSMLRFSLQYTLALLIVTLLIAWLGTRRIRRTLVAPINRIAKAAQEYVKDRQEHSDNKDHFASLNIRTGDELENLSLAMADMERELMEYEDHLTTITAEKERIGTELMLATKIQAAMLPHSFPPFPDRNEFDIYATMEPAREVGGDFYDFFLIDEDHLGLVMADVSGKGIPAALFMMISKTILQSCAMLGRSSAEILSKTNEAICSKNQADMFVTVWFGILEISTGIVTAANAGHEYPAVCRADGSFELMKDKHGLVIGGMDGINYKEYQIQLFEGDKIFVYTDGITEATDRDEVLFGTDRMLEALNSEPAASPEQILKNVRDAVRVFVKESEQFDDMTMMCIEYKGNSEKRRSE